MATVTTEKVLHGEAMQYSWTVRQSDTTGDAITAAEYGDRTVQIGTSGVTGFGTATVTLQGSNDNTNWFTLTDPQGTGIAKTSASIETVMEVTRYTRAIMTGATGSESVPVILFCRRTRR